MFFRQSDVDRFFICHRADGRETRFDRSRPPVEDIARVPERGGRGVRHVESRALFISGRRQEAQARPASTSPAVP